MGGRSSKLSCTSFVNSTLVAEGGIEALVCTLTRVGSDFVTVLYGGILVQKRKFNSFLASLLLVSSSHSCENNEKKEAMRGN